jgi:hypothetical protein
MFIGYEWQNLYSDALLETDWTKIEDRIDAADVAINRKRKEFESDHGGTPEETQAIEDALNALNVLKREVVVWRQRRAG